MHKFPFRQRLSETCLTQARISQSMCFENVQWTNVKKKNVFKWRRKIHWKRNSENSWFVENTVLSSLLLLIVFNFFQMQEKYFRTYTMERFMNFKYWLVFNVTSWTKLMKIFFYISSQNFHRYNTIIYKFRRLEKLKNLIILVTFIHIICNRCTKNDWKMKILYHKKN